jgi:hypothetical protein
LLGANPVEQGLQLIGLRDGARAGRAFQSGEGDRDGVNRANRLAVPADDHAAPQRPDHEKTDRRVNEQGGDKRRTAPAPTARAADPIERGPLRPSCDISTHVAVNPCGCG